MKSNELNEILNKTRRTPNISLTPKQVEELIKDLERLEAIDNAKPSDAIDRLDYICKILNEKRIDIKWLFKEDYNTITHALLKAQEQDKILQQLKTILSMDYLVRVYGYEMAKRLQTYLKSNDAVKRWLDGKD